MWPINGPVQGNDLQQLSAVQTHSLRASTALKSLWHAVEICSINSIEAGASEVHLEVDASSFSFKIVDNGHGLSPADLKLLGTWNITSKNSKSTQHVGIGLASICSTAVVEITSRAAGSFETHACLLRAGELLQLKLAAEQKPRSGTTIIARDMFFNRPITRKSLENGRPNKEIERCRDVLTGLALLRPDVTFTLHDKGTRSFIVKHLKGQSQLQMVSEFFGNPYDSIENVAQLIEDPSNLPGNNSASCSRSKNISWQVAGWAVRPPLGHPTSSRQRVFINNRAVKAPLLCTMVDEIFSELYKAVIKLYPAHPATTAGDLLSVRKANNQHAMFILSLSCPPELVEILPEAGGGTVLVEDWAPVQEAVRKAVLAAWNPVLNTALLKETEEMRRNASNLGSGRAGSAPSSIVNYNGNRAIRRSVSERAPSRAAGGSSQQSRQQQQLYQLAPQRSTSTGSRDNILPSLLMNPPVPSTHNLLSLSNRRQQQQQQPSLMASWRQRRELSRSRIATGAAAASMNLPPAKRLRSSWSAMDITVQKATGIHSPHASLSSKAGNGSSDLPKSDSAQYSALDAILSSWKNPAMMPDTSTGKTQAIISLEDLSSAVFARLRPEALDREDLQGARALHQIDSKFVPIVCSNGVLALVDQHAADERVQLEKLRAQVVASSGGPANGACPSMQLPSPQPLRLGADEIPLLEAFGKVVWQWGWRWVTYPAPAAAPEVLVEVTAVPLIAQRALTATDMRLYLHDLAATNGASGPPSGIIRVLNSKACRSAIMFGDELLPAQCQGLIDNLQNTQMCFICAHGRPTTVPVVDLVAVGKAAAVLQAASPKKKDLKKSRSGLVGLKEKLLATLNE